MDTQHLTGLLGPSIDMSLSYITEMLDISLRPRNCDSRYTCEVNDATEIHWKTNTSTDDRYQYTGHSPDNCRVTSDVQVCFVRKPAANNFYNFTSTLEVINEDLNGTDLQCIGYSLVKNVSNTVQICVKGIQQTQTVPH